MEYYLEIRYDDPRHNARVMFASTLIAATEELADVFVSELLEAFKRKNVSIIHWHYDRIDNNVELWDRKYEEYLHYIQNATAELTIEQFLIEKPDQTKSIADNLTAKLWAKENAIAFYRDRDFPIVVRDKATGNPISRDFYYFTIEHLIDKNV